ncbi:MAG: hypothetical protein AAFQ82_01945 [Myxococcota bacterium]
MSQDKTPAADSFGPQERQRRSESHAVDGTRPVYEAPAVISVSKLEEVTLFSCVFDPGAGDINCN